MSAPRFHTAFAMAVLLALGVGGLFWAMRAGTPVPDLPAVTGRATDANAASAPASRTGASAPAGAIAAASLTGEVRFHGATCAAAVVGCRTLAAPDADAQLAVRECTTDAVGRFEFAGVRVGGLWELVASYGGRAGVCRPVRAGTPCIIDIEDARMLRGEVVDDECRPIQRAQVTVCGIIAGRVSTQHVVADDEGRFVVTQPVLACDGEHDILLGAAADGYLDGFARVAASGPPSESVTRITLLKGRVITGRVTTLQAGAPVVDVAVQLVARCGPGSRVDVIGRQVADWRFGRCVATARTNTAGEFSMRVPEGAKDAALLGYLDQRLLVEAAGFVPALIDIERTETARIDIALARGAAIAGRVVDQHGTGLAVAYVQCLGPTFRPPYLGLAQSLKGQTDADGNYLIANALNLEVREDVTVVAMDGGGYGAESRTSVSIADVRGSTAHAQDIVMPQIALARVRIVDRETKLPVTLAAVTPNGGWSPWWRPDATPDAAGVITCWLTPRPRRPAVGTRCEFDVNAEGYGSARGLSVASSGDAPLTLEVLLDRAVTVTGRVVWSDGTPARAVVRACPPAVERSEQRAVEAAAWPGMGRAHGVVAEATTDRAGNFVLKGLPTGRYRLIATDATGAAVGRQRASREAPIASGTIDVDVPAAGSVTVTIGPADHRVRGAAVRGVIVDESGRRLATAGTVSLRAPGDAWSGESARVAQGVFRVDWLECGAWSFSAALPGVACAAETITVTEAPPGEDLEVVLHAFAGERVIVNVLGEPAVVACVGSLSLSSRATGNGIGAKVDDRGVAAFVHAEPGATYDAWVSGGDRIVLEPSTLVVAAAGATEVTVQARAGIDLDYAWKRHTSLGAKRREEPLQAVELVREPDEVVFRGPFHRLPTVVSAGSYLLRIDRGPRHLTVIARFTCRPGDRRVDVHFGE